MNKRLILCMAALLTGLAATAQTEAGDSLRRVAGVRVGALDNNPAGALAVYIRGLQSLRTDSQPLWVLDGTMLSADLAKDIDAFWQYGKDSYTAPLDPLAFLAPEDIESIEVLKDASATALYGTRGANGVILVTTRRGKGAEKIEGTSEAGINTSATQGVGGNGFRHSHRIALSGSKERTSYLLSGHFRSEDGVTVGSRFRSGGLKANFETAASQTVRFGFNALMGISSSSSPTGTAWPGKPSAMLALRSPETDATPWHSDYDDDNQEARGVFSSWLALQLSPKCSLQADLGVDAQRDLRQIWYGPLTAFGATGPDNVNGGAAAVLSSMLLGYNAKAVAGYHTFLGVDHSVKASLGAGLLGHRQSSNTMNGKDFVNHSLRSDGLGLSNSMPLNRKFRYRYFHPAVFATLTYAWKATAGTDLSFRVDHTPTYGALRYYPAVSAWAELGPLVPGVSTFRLEGGWGLSGGEQVVPYEHFGDCLTGEPYVPETGMEPFISGLDVLTAREWHFTGTAGFLGGRILVEVTGYDRRTAEAFDIYDSAGNPILWKGHSYPRTVTPVRVDTRECALANRGIEASLRIKAVDRERWGWTISADAAWNNHRITASDTEDYTTFTCHIAGLPASSLYGFDTDADGNFRDLTGEGRVTEADRILLGNTLPKLYGGLQSLLRWKALTLDVQLDGAAFFHVADLNRLFLDHPDGQPVLTPEYVEDGTFLRVGLAGLRYRIPVRTTRVKDLELRFAAKNLLLVTGYRGRNPDVDSFGNRALTHGLDYGSFPLVRSFILGVHVTL